MQHHDKFSMEKFSSLHKPPWISDEIWKEVFLLEKKFPEALVGILQLSSYAARQSAIQHVIR